MDFCKQLAMLISVVIMSVSVPESSQNLTDMYYKCSRNRNYTSGSGFELVLRSLMTNYMASSNETNNGFFNVTNVLDSNRVYSVALCRGDVTEDVCRSCVDASTDVIMDLCPFQKEVVMWTNECMLRYSNQSIYGVLDFRFGYIKWNEEDVLDADLFNFKGTLSELLSVLRDNAVAGNASLKFEVGEAKLAENRRIYALVQCTPDLSKLQCGRCLDIAISEIPRRIPKKQGGKSLGASCNVRFQTYKFYNIQSSVALLPPQVRAKGNGKRTVITVVVAVSSVCLIFCSGFIFFRVRKSRVKCGEETGTKDSLQMDFEALSLATDNFTELNMLGEGAFGAVYKGKLLDGQDIAVKKLSKNSKQGDDEFKNEVLLLAKLQHKNLVRLIGFCLSGVERLLVYELVPYASLDQFLIDDVKRAGLSWQMRYNIIEGIARGLLYLHQDSALRIIHRDLKASNILLDAKFNPKISDFGMARLFKIDQTQCQTGRIVGTYGYMAPEYVIHGQFSVKSDVYSFGVLVLELTTGQMNNNFIDEETGEILFGYVWRKWREDQVDSVIDSSLSTDSRTEILRCLHIGLLCVQENALARPTMAAVLLMLSTRSTTLTEPMQPAFVIQNAVQSEELQTTSTQRNIGGIDS